MENRPTVAYVIDPRFPGGTSSAVAAELEVMTELARVEVVALSTAMFKGRPVAAQLQEVFETLRLDVVWDPETVSADLVIFHNPACLKFQEQLGTQIISRHLIVVTHENFSRPGDTQAFDVAGCLDQILAGSLCLQRTLAPVSAWNRQTVQTWIAQNDLHDWALFDRDWFNICAPDLLEPTARPADRRGRHSRPGFEKFPSRSVMKRCFPETAERNIILGGDIFVDQDPPAHWQLHPFRGLSVARYFDMIDFMVYFTAATWRESFGRVLVEALAAGKIVITDPQTASSFDGAVVGAQPDDVDAIIDRYIAMPETYRRDVLAAQSKLSRFSPDAFAQQASALLRTLT